MICDHSFTDQALTPIFDAILGAAFLGEPLGMIHYFFGRLIIAGGLWGTLGKENQRSKER